MSFNFTSAVFNFSNGDSITYTFNGSQMWIISGVVNGEKISGGTRAEPCLNEAMEHIRRINDQNAHYAAVEAAPFDAVTATREELNDWYEKQVGHRPDESGEMPMDELRALVVSYQKE